MKLLPFGILIWILFTGPINTKTLVDNSTRAILPFEQLRPKIDDDSAEDQKGNYVEHKKPTSTTVVPTTRSPDFLYCEQEQYLHEYVDDKNKSQMLWVTWNRTKAGENALLPNMCSGTNGWPLKRRCVLKPLAQRADWETPEKNTTMIQCRYSMYCESEPFEHYYILGRDELQRHTNSWKRSVINRKSTLQDVCLKTSGLPLTRLCFYDASSRRAMWESVPQYKDYKCLSDTQQEIISQDLNYLLVNMSRRNFISDLHQRHETSTKLVQLLEKPRQRLLPADVHLSNEILKVLTTDTQDVELSSNVLKITHNLMASDTTVLRMSAELNATNSLLDTFESYMDSIGNKFVAQDQCSGKPSSIPFNTTIDNNGTLSSVEMLNFIHIGVYAHVSRNISVFFVNPNCANISGIALYPSKLSSPPSSLSHMKVINYDSFNDFHYRFIYMNESAAELLSEPDMELGAFVPLSMWQQLNVHFSLLGNSPVIVFKVYDHDGLFVESDILRLRKPFSKILSISIPGYDDVLPENLPFLLRASQTGAGKVNPNTGCGYWNYSTWTSAGVQTSNVPKGNNISPLMLCYTNHLTQFSYLVGGNYKQNDLTNEILITAAHQQALDIISLVGCTLSLMGLVGIWITALMFKSWRSQASNKVLLNMCVALTLQMTLFLFVNTDDVSEDLVEEHKFTKCVFVGALLQYSILVLFTWMLLIAFLQFQRYVTVIGIQRPKHYIAKSAVLAWGLPLIPTMLVAFIDPYSYIPSADQLVTDSGVCYPSGSGLHYGVILPIGLIVLANFMIFVYVFYSISRTLGQTLHRSEKKLVIKQIRLSILLFFLLGLSWIFGLFAFMKAGIVFSYLFCLTATLQGFVLFVYFVILDQTSRESWQKVLCPQRAKKMASRANELQSMATASTSNGLDISHVEH